MTPDDIRAMLEGPETLDLLAFHLRNMADTAFSDQIDADRVSRAANVIAALEARVKELEEALRPFARSIQDNYFHQNDDLRILCGHGKDDLRWVIPMGDWRRARALLGDKP